MKERDTIINYFRTKIIDSYPVEADWNVPSDEIFNAAKVHFPKKKKRRFGLFFLLGLGLAIAIASMVIASNYVQDNLTDKQEIIITNNELSQNASVQDEIQKSAINDNPVIPPIEKNNKSQIISSNQDKKEIKHQDLRSKQKEKKTGSSITPLPSEDQSIRKKVSKSSQASERSSNIDKQQLSSMTSITQSLYSAQNPIISAPLDKIDKKSVTEQSMPLQGLSLAKLAPIRFSQLTQNEMKIKQQPFISPRKMHKWEVGLTTAPLMIMPFNISAVEEEDHERAEIKLRYFNINGYITRRFNKRLSVTTGVMFSDFDGKLAFTASELYSEELGVEDVKDYVDNNIGFGSLTINDKSTKFEVELNQGVALQVGDSLIVDGRIEANGSVYQIPLFFNYHIQKKRFDWVLHAGASFDILDISIPTLDFKVYMDDELITQPVNFPGIRERYTDFSIYAGGGVKYDLGKNLKAGAIARFDITDLFFSRIDVGLYYGF